MLSHYFFLCPCGLILFFSFGLNLSSSGAWGHVLNIFCVKYVLSGGERGKDFLILRKAELLDPRYLVSVNPSSSANTVCTISGHKRPEFQTVFHNEFVSITL